MRNRHDWIGPVITIGLIGGGLIALAWSNARQDAQAETKRWRVKEPNSKQPLASTWNVEPGVPFRVVGFPAGQFAAALEALPGRYYGPGAGLPQDWPADDYWGPAAARVDGVAGTGGVQIVGPFGVWELG